ncbi:MAG TPA: tRNA preQ1(34) S-adenosylmethionine ribosyltransferase-isomerase QueA, partial [Gammaproteobacteria bacterium]|nr:tRNA preQ1(34) S-adenosylmethionine ribosyltransferase-isomerase QueA [Gammaproteobacteria bacterium]
MRLSDYDFDLPKSLIAQNPKKSRTDSRLLVPFSTIIDAQFSQIANFLRPNDLLVMNNTRVIPARLFATKMTGGRVEIMIERIINNNSVLAMIRASIAPK